MNDRDKTISMNIIGQLPDIILEQVTKLAFYYIGYMRGNIDYTTTNSIDFVNNVMDATNMINKIIAIAADGSDVEAIATSNGNTSIMLKAAYDYCRKYAPGIIEKITQVQQPEDKSIEQAEEESVNGEENKESLETYLELFKSILDEWGINPDTTSYNIITSMPEYVKSTDGLDEVINKMIERYGKSKMTIYGCLNYVLKHANFSKSKIIPKLSKMGDSVTLVDMMRELISLCLYVE